MPLIDQYQQRLKSLNTLSIELALAPTFDDLCRQAIEQGRERLGFDRLGIWFFDESLAHIEGSFGTDEHGQTRDERGKQVPVTKYEYDMIKTMEEKESRIFVGDAPLYNDHGQIVGYGSKATAMLWDGNHTLGTISTDNLLTRRPITPFDLEILTLYGTTIGHLCTRKRAEEALLRERNLLRTIIDTAQDYIFVKNADLRIALANHFFWSRTPNATCEADVIGKTDFDTLPFDIAQNLVEQDRNLIQGGEPIVNQETRLVDRFGNDLCVLESRLPLRDSQGKIVGLVCVARDITERKQAEQERLELALNRERVELLTEVVSNISHDLKTPLTVINSSLYLLERTTDPERRQAKIQTIKEQTEMLEKRIQDILTMTRLDHAVDLTLMSVDLNQLFRDASERFETTIEHKKLHVVAKLAPDLPDISANQDELYRAIVNLLENALTYTPEGGSITLKTGHSATAITAEISDTGIGIGQNDLLHIFEPFYRADPARSVSSGGTGLGLAIVKKIVDMHGGEIAVESQVGKGTSFRLIFPLD